MTASEIKYIKQLHQKKFRETEKKFIVEGEKRVEELLLTDWKTEVVYATREWKPATKIKSFPVKEIKESELERISALSAPNKVLAVVHFPSCKENIPGENNFLLLDEIKDPGNLGTIIRTADWFGIKTVYCSENSVELFNPKTVQSSMGSVFRVKCFYVSLAEKISELKKNGTKIVGACMDGKNAVEFSFPAKAALIMGSESHGISAKIEAFLDEKITIPGKGKAESLNVSVATGILLSLIAKEQ